MGKGACHQVLPTVPNAPLFVQRVQLLVPIFVWLGFVVLFILFFYIVPIPKTWPHIQLALRLPVF